MAITTKKVAFFTERGVSRGLGHYSRCKSISLGLKKYGFDSIFYIDDNNTSNLDKNELPINWASLNINRKFDICFVDSYLANIDHYNQISSLCNSPIFIDDYERIEYPPGIILNFSPDAEKIFFKKKESNYKYLLGLKYLPLRPKIEKFVKHKGEHILLMLGGYDTKNLSKRVLSILDRINIKKVVISINKNISQNIENINGVSFIHNPSEEILLETISRSLFAITTASMSAYEIGYFKIPSIVISIAKNQKIGANRFISSGIANYHISITDFDWQNKMTSAIDKLLTLKTLNKNDIDGLGVERIITEILKNEK